MKRACRIRRHTRQRRLWTRFARRWLMSVTPLARAPAAFSFASSQARASRAFRRSAAGCGLRLTTFLGGGGPIGCARATYQQRLQHFRCRNWAGGPEKPHWQVSVGGDFMILRHGAASGSWDAALTGLRGLVCGGFGAANVGESQTVSHQGFHQSFSDAAAAGRSSVLLPLFLKKGGSIELPGQAVWQRGVVTRVGGCR